MMVTRGYITQVLGTKIGRDQMVLNYHLININSYHAFIVIFPMLTFILQIQGQNFPFLVHEVVNT